MSYLVEHVYNGHDNPVALQLTRRGSLVPLDGVTRITVTVGETTIDSDTEPTAILWAQPGYAVAEVRLFFGMLGLPVGQHGAWLVVYDAGHANGTVWAAFVLQVHDEVEAQ